jgi:HAD superfamily hydrolase (TIGR01490 family)
MFTRAGPDRHLGAAGAPPALRTVSAVSAPSETRGETARRSLPMIERRPGWLPAHYGHGVAVFDLDRTLIPGSSLAMFGRELVRQGLVSRRSVLRHAGAEQVFRRRGLGGARIDDLVRRLLDASAGRDVEPLLSVARSMGPALAARIPPSARFLVDHHLRAGDFCIVLSASPHELVEAVTSELGAHRAVGTRVGVHDGVLTGRLDGPFCYGVGKLEALEREVGRLDLATATAYADSGSDLPLLEQCGTAVAVNPDAELRRWAQARGWPVVRFG